MKKTAIVLLVTVALLFVLRQFVVVPYSVPYEGMEPTLGEGERVLVNKWGYGSSSSDKAKTVERGAIMVFHNPAEKPDVAIDDRAVFIARIYGLAGDTLMLNRQLVPVPPPAPLAPAVIDDIGNKIREINQSKGTSILLVEQNVHLAFGAASYCYTLQVGEMVAEGSVEEIRNNDVVKKAYIGG